MQPRSLMLKTDVSSFGGLDVAFHVAIHMKSAGELDVAMDPGFDAHERADRSLITSFLA